MAALQALQFVESARGLAAQGQQAQCVVAQQRSRGGQRAVACGAVEKGFAHRCFELANHLADGWLRAVQAHGGARTALFGPSNRAPRTGSTAALPAARLALEELRGLRETLFATGTSLARSYDSIPKKASPRSSTNTRPTSIFSCAAGPTASDPTRSPRRKRANPRASAGPSSPRPTDPRQLGKAAQASVDSAYAEAEKAYDAGPTRRPRAAFSRALALVAPGAEVLRLLGPPAGERIRARPRRPARQDRGGARRPGTAEPARGPRRRGAEAFASLASSYVAASRRRSPDYSPASAQTLPLADVRTARTATAPRSSAIEASWERRPADRPALARRPPTAATALGRRPPDCGLRRLLGAAGQGLRRGHGRRIRCRPPLGAGIEGDYIERELAARTAAVSAAEALIEGFPSHDGRNGPRGLPRPLAYACLRRPRRGGAQAGRPRRLDLRRSRVHGGGKPGPRGRPAPSRPRARGSRIWGKKRPNSRRAARPPSPARRKEQARPRPPWPGRARISTPRRPASPTRRL